MDNASARLQKHIETLCLTCGSRHCGSEGERLAAEYIENYFKELGLEVISEEFPSRGWKFESFEFYNVTKDRPVSGGTTACFFSSSVDLEGKLLFLSLEDLSKLEQIPLSGRMCVVTRCTGFERNRLTERLEALGAGAVIFPCANAGSGANTKLTRSPFINRIGTVCVNLNGAYDLSANPDDTYRLHIQAKPFDTTSRNIVARIGSGSKKCVVGGHYDTAPLIQGANDNASGTAMVLELARLMRNEALPFVLEFVAFSAEEYCHTNLPYGSGCYLQRHKEEDILWYFNCDSCPDTFSATSLLLGLADKLPALDTQYPILEKTTGGDNATFCTAGIPAVWLRSAPYFTMLHTIEDSVDKLDYTTLTAHLNDTYALLKQLIEKTTL